MQLAIFYMYMLKKRIDDPTTSKIAKEVVLFLSMAIPTVLFSLGSGRFHCAYLQNTGTLSLDEDLTLFAGIIGFWSILALPVLQYLRYAVIDACTGFLMKAMRTQLRFMAYMVHVICLQIVLKVLAGALQLALGYDTDTSLVRCIK